MSDSSSPPPSVPLMQGLDEVAVLRSLFTAYPDALLVADASGTIVMANAVAARLLGYAESEMVGLKVDDLVPDTIRPRHAAYREGLREEPAHAGRWARRWNWWRARRDGSEVMVEIALSPLQGHGLPLVVAGDP